jgi:hypothetical protein
MVSHDCPPYILHCKQSLCNLWFAVRGRGAAVLLLFTGSVMIVFLGFYYFPDTIPGIVLQPPKKGAFSTKKYWYLYK